jgi:hypothetical protein
VAVLRLWRRFRCAVGGHELCVTNDRDLSWSCLCGSRVETFQSRIFLGGQP